MPDELQPRRLDQRKEDVYLVAVLLLVLGWLIPLTYSLSIGSIGYDAAEDPQVGARALSLQAGTPLFQGLIGCCYVVSGTMLLLRQRFARLPLPVLLPAGIVILAMASWLWSETPDITLRRSIGLLGTTILAFHLGWRCDWHRLSRLLGIALGIACISSILASQAFPDWAVHHGGDHDGDWRGLFIHKNNAGSAMVVCLLAAAANAATDWPARKRWSLLLAAVAVIGIIGSGSRTAWLLGSLVALLSLWVVLLRQHRMAAQVLLLVSVALVASAGIAVYDVFASAAKPEEVRVLGRDLTATGRYNLWSALAPYIADRSLFGYGFRGFWSGQGPCLALWDALGWEPANAHSSWIDTLLELGIFGIGLVLGWVAAYLAAMRTAWRTMPPGQTIWVLGILVLLVVQGLSDTTLLEPNAPLWTLALAAYFHLLRPRAAAAAAPA